MGYFDYNRRKSSEVSIGKVKLGGDNPVRVQSMTNTSTMDTEGSVAQALRIADAGGEIVRLTAQGVREADNIGEIRSRLHAHGVEVPLVADIHFNPRAAFAAAKVTDKVRINPGNFVDPGRTFRKLTYTDEEYHAELDKIDNAFTPFLELCREHGTAIRIGVNHGSLSDRIMSRYGDSPAGMVESAMEFLRVAVKRHFADIVISIKASNVVIMVETVRRLVAAMDAEDMHFPLHLGVTEAGDGEDGRVKSAVGIGTLLLEGIGDTIRVSLSEAPENEIPVAKALVDYIASKAGLPPVPGSPYSGHDSTAPSRRRTTACGTAGGDNVPLIGSEARALAPETTMALDVTDGIEPHMDTIKANPDKVLILSTSHGNQAASVAAAVHSLMSHGASNPVIARLSYNDTPADKTALYAATDFGYLLLHGLIDGIELVANALTDEEADTLSLSILQASRQRISKTEYIACPGCGRTLFALESTLKAVKEATSHLKGLKIGVMGCIVNGPGEMADADYGYVGAASGHISLYKGKQCVEKNIPQENAIPKLIELIKAGGDWREP